MPGDSPRQDFMLSERRAVIARRYLQGAYQSHIAKELGMTPGYISQEMKIIRNLWLASTVRDFDAARAEELARIDLAESEAWAAWNTSKEQHETTIQERNNGKLKVSRKLEGQAGDPRYLEMVLKCIDRRCQILGLDAPKRFTIDWDLLTDIQMERLARGEPVQSVLAHPLEPPALSMPESEYADADTGA
ncbi:MAG TPA: hypothetical protein VI542_07380 [Candidatus Tectomicrobia bacterium]